MVGTILLLREQERGQFGAGRELGYADQDSPVHRLASTPTKHEKTDGNDAGGRHCNLQTSLGLEVGIRHHPRDEVVLVVGEEGDHGDDTSYDEAEEGQTLQEGKKVSSQQKEETKIQLLTDTPRLKW
jgi:hypothetical protein